MKTPGYPASDNALAYFENSTQIFSKIPGTQQIESSGSKPPIELFYFQMSIFPIFL